MTRPASDRIVEEIVINAPADRVFEALANPAERVRWWGAPGRFETTHMESDLRTGGAWLMRGIGLGGQPFTIRGEYRAIQRPHLLEFTWLPDWQGDDTVTLVRVEMSEKNGVTTVRLTHSGFVTQQGRDSHRGWPQILGWLKTHAEAVETAH